MWNEIENPRLRVETLKELDALVGKYLTGETPQTYWEEQHASLRFDTIDEALEAMHDPYFQQFIPEGARPYTSLKEVREFRRYSTDLAVAWEVADCMANARHPLKIQREQGRWIAAFGASPAAESESVSVAICLAGLRARGIDVDLMPDWSSPPPASTSVRVAA